MSSGIWTSFFAALQASMAVLLTIGSGTIASRYNLLKEGSARDISKLCVRLFLPALLIVNVGSELEKDTVARYVPVILWAVVYTLLSMGLGMLLQKMLKWPAWTTPAICFNNTTALPLLLIQALDTAGILNDLTLGEGDSSAAAAARAKSYFLVASVVGNGLTFAIGPHLLDDEETPEEVLEARESRDQEQQNNNESSDEEHANPTNSSGRTAEEEEEHANESTSLLPNHVVNHRIVRRVDNDSTRLWEYLPDSIQSILSFIRQFINAPIVGAFIGVIIGLTPALHKAFFNDPSEGGVFKTWLTAALKNVGELFAALQLVVVGSKLSTSLLKMKRGEDSGPLKIAPTSTIFLIRFILWPILSIGLIYTIASNTNWLQKDPVLYFVLMLLPTGPSATKLTALADVSDADDSEKMAIAKFVSISYLVSPIICFTVVGSLKATQAIES